MPPNGDGEGSGSGADGTGIVTFLGAARFLALRAVVLTFFIALVLRAVLARPAFDFFAFDFLLRLFAMIDSPVQINTITHASNLHSRLEVRGR